MEWDDGILWIPLTVKTAVGWHKRMFDAENIGNSWKGEDGQTHVNILGRGSIVVKENADWVRYAKGGHGGIDG